jgi:putative ABC transport system permease protein
LLQRAGKYDSLFVAADLTDIVDLVEEEIRAIYGNDIGITTVQAILETVEEFTGGINSFLSSIAIVSLVVGAVGIITTLYTSVAERIREIGTLKAIGARNVTILGLFLMEAVLIGIIGATLGLGAGIGTGYILVSSSPGGGGGERNENVNDTDNSVRNDEMQTSTQDIQEPQQAETLDLYSLQRICLEFGLFQLD